MRIIKAGSLPEEKLLQGKCSNCKCEVEFKQGEATRSCHRNEVTFSITCPTEGCGHTIAVDA